MAARTIVLSLVLAALASTALLAQQSPTPVPSSSGRSKPLEVSEAEIRLPDRLVEIHRTEQTGKNVGRPLYYLKPVLAFEETASPPDGWPKWVHEIQVDGDRAAIILRVLAWTREVLAMAQERVQKDDSEWLLSFERDPSQARVRPWPTDAVSVEILDRIFGDLLALGQSKLTDTDKAGTYQLIVQPQVSLDKLQEVLQQPGRVKIHFSLKYPGIVQETAKAIGGATFTAREAIESVVASVSRYGPQQDIFQEERSRFENEVTRKLYALVGAGSDEVMELLGLVDFGKIFTEAQLKDIADQDAGFLEAVWEYLKPVLSGQDITEEEVDLETTSGRRVLKVDFALGVNKGPVYFKLSPETESNFERKKGVTLTKKDFEKWYTPAQISVVQIRSGWTQEISQQVRLASRAVGRVTGFQDEADILPKFTRSVFERSFPSKEGSVADSFSQVPIGSMLCSFRAGSEPPEGFIWADGATSWPQEAWVPKDLRGANVPDMDAMLVGGTIAERAVGSVSAEGRLVLPKPQSKEPTSVLGTPQWGLQNAQLGRYHKGGDGRPYRDPSKVMVAQHGDAPVLSWHVPAVPKLADRQRPDPRQNSAQPAAHHLEIYTPEQTVSTYSFPEPERTIVLDGSYANPPFVQCRWIIRVR